MVINFAAGPAQLPKEVLVEVQKQLVDYKGHGLSVMEMSHRGVLYNAIHESAIKKLRELLCIPDNYKVLFMQGGGTGLFAAVCMNLLGRTGAADYIVTGSWSEKAAKEATKYGIVNLVIPKAEKFQQIPSEDVWKLDPNASYLYYCDNETVDGVEFGFMPKSLNDVPLVCDMSSNFLSRKVDVSKYGLIFAGAQKNVGPAGVTIVIVRDDLIGHAMKITPSVFDFAVLAKNNSLYNTPPCFGIYVIDCVLDWIKKHGGIDGMAKNADIKSQLIYKVIDESNGFYNCPVVTDARSRMNLPFRIGSIKGDDDLENKFLKGAEVEGMIQLKGHRSVGGIRASLYNAITIAETERLADYMIEFCKNNQAKA
ncbi:probable phosphoserine aminotransferase [Condylostylus longicornis]|uniref:probable phosphoserine aminotransferase n=1 Tax=Condylostylus longicornis TaxID=2530218 RepID=UPI00244DC8D4|nr:probable phosphoserine aminotransferase [Condylostylus longicornis]